MRNYKILAAMSDILTLPLNVLYKSPIANVTEPPSKVVEITNRTVGCRLSLQLCITHYNRFCLKCAYAYNADYISYKRLF